MELKTDLLEHLYEYEVITDAPPLKKGQRFRLWMITYGVIPAAGHEALVFLTPEGKFEIPEGAEGFHQIYNQPESVFKKIGPVDRDVLLADLKASLKK